MFEYIKGTVSYIAEDYIVLENNGIGYRLFTSGITGAALRLHSESIIYTYMNVREDDVSLFGFASRDELSAFKLLISVSGVGPKGALAILSVLSVNELKLAIISDDTKAIAKANGIGPKTAQRIALELRDKFKLEEAFDDTSVTGILPDMDDNDIITETALALTALGYSQLEAVKAIKKVDNAGSMSVEELLKAALKKII